MVTREAERDYIPQSSLWHQASWNSNPWTSSLEVANRHIIKNYPWITAKDINSPPTYYLINPWEREEALGFSKTLIDTKNLAWILDKIKLNLEKFEYTDNWLSRKISSRKK